MTPDAGSIGQLNQSSDAIYQHAPAVSLKSNNLKYFLIRQLLEKKEVEEIEDKEEKEKKEEEENEENCATNRL